VHFIATYSGSLRMCWCL